MPEGAVPRALFYVALLFLLCLASTFAWWAAANVVRAEYRRLLSGLACSMRIYFYSISLLCILVAARALHIGPHDPGSTLFSWIHVGGTVAICVPSAMRAFRVKGPRLAGAVLVGWSLSAAMGYVAYVSSAGFRSIIDHVPLYLTGA